MSESMEHEIRTLRAHFWSDRDPDGRAFAPLAEAYLSRGDVEEALALVQDGLGRLPDYATGHLVAARVHRVRGDQAAARGAVEALLALDRGNAPGLRLLGEISEEAGDVQAAIDAFRDALARDPGYADLEGRIARLGHPAAAEAAGAPADPTDAGVDGLEPEVDTSGTKAPDGEGLAQESPGPMGTLEPGSAPPESPAQGSGDAEEERFQIESFGSVEEDLEELDAALQSSPGAEFGSELDFESDSGSDPVPSPSPSPLSPSEDLIFHTFDDPMDDVPEAEASSGEPAPPLATRTMAELYIRQGFTDRGLEVYRQLVERDPGNLEIRGRLEELESAARGDPSGEDAPAAGAAISDAPAGVAPQGTGIGTPDSEERADSGTDGVGEGDERAIPVDAGAEDDPWGSAPQWTGGDPETGATDRSPFAWVPDPEDAEGEDMSEIQGPGGDAVQEAARGRGPSAGQYLQDLLAWEPGAVPIESLAPEAGPGEAGGDLHEESLSSEPGDDRGQDPSHPGSRGE